LKRHATGFELAAGPEAVDQVVDRLRAARVSIRGLSARRLNLEQAFIDLVQHKGTPR